MLTNENGRPRLTAAGQSSPADAWSGVLGGLLEEDGQRSGSEDGETLGQQFAFEKDNMRLCNVVIVKREEVSRLHLDRIRSWLRAFLGLTGFCEHCHIGGPTSANSRQQDGCRVVSRSSPVHLLLRGGHFSGRV